MKTLICILGLWAAVAYAQLDLSTLRQAPEHEASGFSGFAFGSSRNYIVEEQAKEGWPEGIWEADWLWYSGNIDGCIVDFGYRFRPNQDSVELLTGGIWEVTDTDECFRIIEATLAESYGKHVKIEKWETGEIETTREIRWTRARHRKNDSGHSVWFFDTRG